MNTRAMVALGVFSLLAGWGPRSAAGADLPASRTLRREIAADVASPEGPVHLTTHYWLRLPKDFDPSKPWPLILFLNGAGVEAKYYFDRWVRDLEPRPVLFASIQSHQESWGPGDHELLEAALKDLSAAYGADPHALFLIGHSAGGAMAVTSSLYESLTPKGVATSGSPFPPTLLNLLRLNKGRATAKKGVALYFMAGERDHPDLLRDAPRDVAILTHLGFNVTYKTLPGQGHPFDFSQNGPLLDWAFSLLSPPPPPAPTPPTEAPVVPNLDKKP